MGRAGYALTPFGRLASGGIWFLPGQGAPVGSVPRCRELGYVFCESSAGLCLYHRAYVLDPGEVRLENGGFPPKDRFSLVIRRPPGTESASRRDSACVPCRVSDCLKHFARVSPWYDVGDSALVLLGRGRGLVGGRPPSVFLRSDLTINSGKNTWGTAMGFAS